MRSKVKIRTIVEQTKDFPTIAIQYLGRQLDLCRLNAIPRPVIKVNMIRYVE